MKSICAFILLFLWWTPTKAQQDLWPRFRGADGSGIASETSKPPVNFSNDNLLWELELPFGVSSPVVWGEKLFITGYSEKDKELTTYCIDRFTGNKLWEKSIRPEKIEKVHPVSSPAQSTAATDGNSVVSFFGSFGMICYDMEGNEKWQYPTPFPTTFYGNAPSPVIVGGKVIMSIDFGDNRFLLAVDKKNGSETWKTQFANQNLQNDGGSATPYFQDDIIVVNKVLEVAAYSAANGSKLWGYPILTAGNSSPIVYGDKVIVSCWFQMSDEETRVEIPAFETILQEYDADKSKTLAYSEFPDSLLYSLRPEAINLEGTSHSLKEVFFFMDQNSDKEVSQNEWESSVTWMKNTFYKPSGLIAININSKGDLSDSSVVWRICEGMPEVPTPVCYQNRVYMVKDGGLVTCVDPADGHIIFKENLGNRGPYFSSPVAANGMIYFFSYNGKLTILKAGGKFEILGQYDFKSKILATPAIIGNTIYVRAGNKLLAYGN